MEILEKTIYRKKNQEINELEKTLLNVSKKSKYNYEQNKELRNKIIMLENEKKELIDKINQFKGKLGGVAKRNNQLKKMVEEIENSCENRVKMLNNDMLEKEKTIKLLRNELEETQKKLEESMTDKFIVKKLRPATGTKTQTMKIKNGYKEGKIISKIKEA